MMTSSDFVLRHPVNHGNQSDPVHSSSEPKKIREKMKIILYSSIFASINCCFGNIASNIDTSIDFVSDLGEILILAKYFVRDTSDYGRALWQNGQVH